MTSTIEWTNRHDWNPVRGCTRASEGCRNCYAEIMAARFSKPGQWGHGFAEIVQTPTGPDHRWTGKVELLDKRLTLPLRWARGVPGRNRVFPNSTSDFFHESLPDAALDHLFAIMALRPDWIFQIPTKRSARMRQWAGRSGNAARIWHLADVIACERELSEWHPSQGYLDAGAAKAPWPLPNVWLGVSVEDQATADQRIPDLLDTPAAVRFISAEPLLGPVDLRNLPFGNAGPTGYRPRILDALTAGARSSTPWHVDWVIVGGESGPGARDNNFLTNARSLLAQCRAAGVPFFGKQNVGKGPLPTDLQVREFPA